jgi:hypothetical protein
MNNRVDALAVLPNGDLIAGGDFTTAGGQVSAYWARYSMTGAPAAALSPSSQSVDSGQSVTLAAAPANGYSNVTYQWTRNGVNISDGPGGASPRGGAVAGSSGSLASPTSVSMTTLTIEGATPDDSGDYAVTFSNACGSATSASADVVVTGCLADFNHDGGIDFSDVSDFFAAWEIGESTADMNQDGGVDGSDTSVFFEVWEAGGC